ncbi:MAG: CsgG/HfaB family protein [Candidatus Omnitrophota bacterium]
MKNKLLLLSVICVTIGIFVLSTAHAQEKPTITVYGFETKASSSIWHSAQWDIGTGLGEMLIDALVASGKFNVVERLNIADITFEQDLMTQGRVSRKTGAKTGKLTGAQYIVRGALTEFDYTESAGGMGLNIKGFNFGLNQARAHIAGIIRIYDATTGEIYASQRFSRTVPATGIDFGYHKGSIGVDLGGFKQTPLGEATHFAIQDIVGFVIAKVPSEAPGLKWICAKCGALVSGAADFCQKCGAQKQEVLESCPNCGADVVANQKFCTSCGKQLTGVKCPSCGKSLKPGAGFCPDCGTRVQ